MHRTLFLAAFVAAQCGHAAEHRLPPTFAELPAPEREIYLAFFRAQLGRPGDHRSFIFFGGYNRNPPEDLLRVLRAEGYDVHPGSEWKEGQTLPWEARKLQWISPTEVKLWGGYGCIEVLVGEWGEYTLVKRNGRWEVVKFESKVVS